MPYVYGNDIGSQAAAAERERSYFDSRADAEYARNANAAARDQANAFQFYNIARQDSQDQMQADRFARAEQSQARQDLARAGEARFTMGLQSDAAKLNREKFEADKKYAAEQELENESVASAYPVAASISEQLAARAAALAKVAAADARFNDIAAVAARRGFVKAPNNQYTFRPNQAPDELLTKQLDFINSEKNLQEEAKRLLNTELKTIDDALKLQQRQAQQLGYNPINEGLVTRRGVVIPYNFRPAVVPETVVAPAAPRAAAAPATYQVGRVYGGLRYLGGDPAKQASWERAR